MSENGRLNPKAPLSKKTKLLEASCSLDICVAKDCCFDETQNAGHLLAQARAEKNPHPVCVFFSTGPCREKSSPRLRVFPTKEMPWVRKIF
jgi:hypothetical protein